MADDEGRMKQAKGCKLCKDNHLSVMFSKDYYDCQCKCHSPMGAVQSVSKGQEGKDANSGKLPEIATNSVSKRNVSSSKVTKVAETPTQDSSPSSFDKLIPDGICFDCKSVTWCSKKVKSIVERDYISKQRVKDALDNIHLSGIKNVILEELGIDER